MLEIQTVSCLLDIPVVRSSTEKLQDVYSKAKETSAFIRLPCSLAETMADKSIKMAATIANPIVTPFKGPARALDDYAAQKFKQMEAKYPAINTPTNEIMSTVKDTTVQTIQQGKKKVTNAATATVNTATDVADSVFTFCETHGPGKTVLSRRGQRKDFGHRSNLLAHRLQDTSMMLTNYLSNTIRQSMHRTLAWFRLLMVFVLLKVKQANDNLLVKFQKTVDHDSPVSHMTKNTTAESSASKLKSGEMSPTSFVKQMMHPVFILNLTIVQRLMIFVNVVLTKLIGQITPNDTTMSELKKMPKHQQEMSMPRSLPVTRINNRPEIVVPRQVEVDGTHYNQIKVNHVTGGLHHPEDIQLLHEKLEAADHITNVSGEEELE